MLEITDAFETRMIDLRDNIIAAILMQVNHKDVKFTSGISLNNESDEALRIQEICGNNILIFDTDVDTVETVIMIDCDIKVLLSVMGKVEKGEFEEIEGE